MQILILQILWNLHENIVIQKSILVAAEQLLVEWQSSTLLAIDLKVLHLFTRLLKLLDVLDVHHGRVEGPGDVSLDLGLGFQDDSRLELEGLRNLVAAYLVLWQIVEVYQL